MLNHTASNRGWIEQFLQGIELPFWSVAAISVIVVILVVPLATFANCD
jgi:hypothetical protein